ncbi:PTS lactose/cellobiose transporter subunit IIA [Spirosoma pollinicola]|uniref:Restriction endonuclease type IV Mrr domain-containing protein n=1 Tax=Spirosoma pollinicola TaxID=2057025 RepID=A0A2K8Z7X2_9BACT|nr:hypothetical protein [Spirosoma pollinicola]AUD05950.1 hypothetical protein CWM47_31360 [Spirosoma pollinicola]
MKISDHFSLKKTQAELDFVDIDTKADLPIFLDPFFLSIRNDNWSIEATLTLRSFFQQLIDLIRENNFEDAKILFQNLHEPNSTCLGMSKGNPSGNGVGEGDTVNIYESLLESKAIQTGLIQDIEDNILFVDKFGKDKLSDMTTNIIKKHLIDYTQSQCNLHSIPLTAGVPSGYFWSRQENDWVAEHTNMLIIDNKPILLISKGVVSFSKAYTPDKYMTHFVLNFLQNEHLKLNSALVKKRKNGTRYVTKDSIKETIKSDESGTKEFLRKFTLDHPEVLDIFKNRTTLDSLTNPEITNIDVRSICTILIERLRNIPPGNDNANTFHKEIIGILELLFYPNLIHPVKEKEIHQGRKRIDITFDNAARIGIFNRFSTIWRIPCQYIFVECKNYSSDLGNPELDQISSRFSVNRGQVGIIVCRSFKDKNLFIQRCRDTYRDNRGLIILLDDGDLVTLLENHNEWNYEFIDNYLSKIVREIAAD